MSVYLFSMYCFVTIENRHQTYDCVSVTSEGSQTLAFPRLCTITYMNRITTVSREAYQNSVGNSLEGPREHLLTKAKIRIPLKVIVVSPAGQEFPPFMGLEDSLPRCLGLRNGS
jgi:hypothetical protein